MPPADITALRFLTSMEGESTFCGTPMENICLSMRPPGYFVKPWSSKNVVSTGDHGYHGATEDAADEKAGLAVLVDGTRAVAHEAAGGGEITVNPR
jgi:hypothetical protein